MGLKEVIEKVTDPYERNARLYPALLAMFPLIAMVIALYGPNASSLSNILIAAGSCGGLFLLTNLGREWGKRLEPKLFNEWGGKPTTQLLRHQDHSIEEVTKERYHDFLSRKINKPFPTTEEEIHNPTAADDVYQSGIRWLLNQTRDPKRFGLLFKENVTYGFRRNALGLKPVGWSLSLCCLLWVLGTFRVFSVSAVKALPETAITSLTASAFMLVVWTAFFTKASTRTAAFTYAETLLRSCDEL